MRLPPLTMLCTIKRPSGSTDAFGAPTGLTNVATDVPCYWWSDASSRTTGGEATGVVATETEHLVLARGTDIQQGDNITEVIDHLGVPVFGEEDYRVVEHVVMQRNHLDCTLRYGMVLGGR